MPDSSVKVFVYLSWYPNGITSDNSIKDPSPVPIFNPTSVPSETLTKDLYCVPNSLTNAKPRKKLIQYPSGYSTGAPRTMTAESPSSNPRAQLNSDQDVLKKRIQEAQFSLQIYLIMFILHIISS